MDDETNHIIAEIARKLKLPYEKVYHVCNFQFEKVRRVVDKGEEHVRLPFLGKFLNYKKWKKSKESQDKA